MVELRNKNNSSQILGTRSALLLRNGNIVDMNGTSDVVFANLTADDYYIAIRHRNHLGIMTQNPQPVGTTAVLGNLIDFSARCRSPSVERPR